MARAATATQPKGTGSKSGKLDLPLQRSVGYQVRMTHRRLQRFLQSKIEPFGVTLGMWYYLRILWNEDGLTQRELSRRIGSMEPTTLTALLSMERSGLVRRVRNRGDRRKMNVHLTKKGRELEVKLLPLAVEVVETATAGLSRREVDGFLRLLHLMQRNLEARFDLASAPPESESI